MPRFCHPRDKAASLYDDRHVPRPADVHELYIRTTPEQLWTAITDPAWTSRYWYGAFNRSGWRPGDRWTSESADGEVYLEGEILEAEPPTRLVHTFHVVHESEPAAEAPSRVSWEISPEGEACRLLMSHEGMGEATGDYTDGGWAYILSGLKTLLETGEPLVIG
jgi:uncharacterized protein YndB with AHSA1/START domain